jgi:hypothetical protein
VKDLDYAPLNSPQFNGNPRGPTPSLSDNDTSLATTEFVKGQNYITSSALSGYATESWVTSQGYLTSAPVTSVAGKTGAVSLVVGDVSGAAPLASPALTGNVTITTNSTSPALFVTQTGTGNILTLHDQASDTTFVAIDQNGKVNTIPSVAASAGFNVPHGAAPTTPVNGDIWTTTGGLFMRQNGTTQQYVDFGGTQTISGIKTFSAASLTFGNSTTAGVISIASGAVASGTKTVNIGTGSTAGTTNINIGTTGGGTATANVNALLISRASTTTQAGLRVLHGTAPTSPVNGDVWTDTAGIYARINGATRSLAAPEFATDAEINSPASTTKVVAPFDVVRMITNRAVFDTQSSSPTFATSGTGAEAYKATNDRATIYSTPNVGVAGYGQMIYDTTASQIGLYGAKRGAEIFVKDFSKKIWMSGTHQFSSLGDANTVTYCMMGGRNTVTTGQPTLEGFGWKLTGGGTALTLITYGWTGSTLAVTETASSFTPVVNQTFDWLILNEGTGAGGASSTCKLYVNDVLVATGINAPGGLNSGFNYMFQSVESTSSQATRMRFIALPIKFWWSKS